MKTYFAIMAALLLFGTIAERDKKDKKMYATCFCFTVVGLVLMTIL